MKCITDLSQKELEGKRVLLRLDLNVPIDNGVITDDYRITTSLETINYLKKGGAKIIILAHLGRDSEATFEPLLGILNDYFPSRFVPNIFDVAARKQVSEMRNGEIVLFENLRQHAGEKNNEQGFINHLASFGDLYVNEAFSNAHRDHASMTGIARQIPSYAGIRFMKEFEMISKAFNPQHPFLVIVGGAKFATKFPLIQNFTAIADTIFLGGALANDIFKYHGYDMSGSSTSDTSIKDIKELLASGKLLVPQDVMLRDRSIKLPQDVTGADSIIDMGELAVEQLRTEIKAAKLIVWNGPLGLYEDGYEYGTDATVKALLECQGQIIIGGGDTRVALSKIRIPENVFVSTAGGAMLDFLVDGDLVAINALNK